MEALVAVAVASASLFLPRGLGMPSFSHPACQESTFAGGEGALETTRVCESSLIAICLSKRPGKRDLPVFAPLLGLDSSLKWKAEMNPSAIPPPLNSLACPVARGLIDQTVLGRSLVGQLSTGAGAP